MVRTPTQTTIARSTIMRSIMRSTTRSIMVVSTVTSTRKRNVDDMKVTDIMKAAAAAIMDRPVFMVMVDMVMKVSMDSRDMEHHLTEEVLFLPL
jgi:hypothetical protein